MTIDDENNFSKYLEELKTMLRMQYALNEDICKKKGLDEINDDNLFFALFDELGELTHELKADWCWWKIHVNKDENKVLEEFVDCVHFALTYEIKHQMSSGWADEDKNNIEEELLWLLEHSHKVSKEDKIRIVRSQIELTIFDCHAHTYDVLWDVLRLGLALGFSLDDIYNEYLKKNKVNFERLESGY